MRKSKVVAGFQINLAGLFLSPLFEEYPTERQMFEYVTKHFPTFRTSDGECVTWSVQKVYFYQ